MPIKQQLSAVRGIWQCALWYMSFQSKMRWLAVTKRPKHLCLNCRCTPQNNTNLFSAFTKAETSQLGRHRHTAQDTHTVYFRYLCRFVFGGNSLSRPTTLVHLLKFSFFICSFIIILQYFKLLLWHIVRGREMFVFTPLNLQLHSLVTFQIKILYVPLTWIIRADTSTSKKHVYVALCHIPCICVFTGSHFPYCISQVLALKCKCERTWVFFSSFLSLKSFDATPPCGGPWPQAVLFWWFYLLPLCKDVRPVSRSRVTKKVE